MRLSSEENSKILRNKISLDISSSSTKPTRGTKRGRVATPGMSSAGSPTKAYRLHFSCENKGRYFRSSKRKIRWAFGFANLSDLRDGTGSQSRGEEHVVELIWSVKSGKTRVFWNNRNISRHFRGESSSSEVVEFAWKSLSGETLQIVAHSSAVPGLDQQYDLYVDGVSFFQLPGLADVERVQPITLDKQETRSDCSLREGLRSISTLSDIGSWKPVDEIQPETLDYRLSMVGLNPGRGNDEVVDELHSELYSSALETVRCRLLETLPQAEQMVSKAIMDAFIAADDSFNDTFSSASSSLEVDASQIEANALCEAYEWTLFHLRYSRREDFVEQTMAVMQRHVTRIFVYIRDEELSSDDAVRILLHIASILGLEFAAPFPMKTVVLCDLSSTVREQDVREIMSGFGSTDAVSVATNKTSNLAFCRYLDSEAAIIAQEAFEGEEMLIGGQVPKVFLLSRTTGQDISMHYTASVEMRQDSEQAFATMIDAASSASFEEPTISGRSSPSLEPDLFYCSELDSFVSPKSVTSLLEFSTVTGDKSRKVELPIAKEAAY